MSFDYRSESTNKASYHLVNSLVKTLAKKGKVSKAYKIIAHVSYLTKIHKQNTLYSFLSQVISIIRPSIGARSSFKFNQKPQLFPLSLVKSHQLAIRWLIQGAKQRSERTMGLRLFNELSDAFNKKGFVLKQKHDWHARLLSSQVKSLPKTTPKTRPH